MRKRTATIRIKRIYDPPEASDGQRILVDRLWPRGVSKAKAALTLWLKDIAPGPDLRMWFSHDPARYTEFALRYRMELAHNKDAVDQMEHLIKQGPVTLLYAAHDEEHNHARVLAAYLHDRARALAKG